MLTDIPGTLIDYVPEVAANLNIDVPGQYYEILPKFYVFIPAEDSAANPNLRTPTPEQIPSLETYVRAVAALWDAYMANPISPDGTAELAAAFTPEGLEFQKTILAESARRSGTTKIRLGNMSVPRIIDGTTVFDCSWLDQFETNGVGEIFDDRTSKFGIRSGVVAASPSQVVEYLYKDDQACL